MWGVEFDLASIRTLPYTLPPKPYSLRYPRPIAHRLIRLKQDHV